MAGETRERALRAAGLSEVGVARAAAVLAPVIRGAAGPVDASTGALRGPLVGLAGLLGAQLLHDLLGTAGWVLLGSGALSGQVDRGWIVAWALLLVTMVPLRVHVVGTGGGVAVEVGAWLRRRLMRGTLALNPEDVRRMGVGRVLGRVIEAERLETLGVDGGIQGMLAAGELLLGVGILGATAPVLLAACAGWLLLATGQALLAYRARAMTADARLSLTDTLTERMLGHRTRLVQAPRDTWHVGEDGPTAAYVDAMAREDQAWGRLEAGCARGWLLVGGAGVGLLAVYGQAAPTLMAALGGVLLVQRALGRACGAAAVISGAVVAWRQVRELLRAPSDMQVSSIPTPDRVAVDARGVRFGYPGRPVLAGAQLHIADGDRVLVEGPSGGGKSTLALLLSGLLRPDGGLLLAGGLDHASLGSEGWRARVVAAPQFHQNHVFGGTLAFNLLMGRTWPPREADLRDATELCVELGLRPLLERMPGGMFQVVGETGWQLSHGERSRVFLARALLRGAPVVVLDESFGALDPATLRLAVATARRRARTLVVVAHP